VCAGGDFYLRKDFDPKIGLTVVVIGALISAIFYWFGKDFIAYTILGGAALIDLVVYGRLKDVAVCYRCHSEFRGRYPRSAGAFSTGSRSGPHAARETEEGRASPPPPRPRIGRAGQGPARGDRSGLGARPGVRDDHQPRDREAWLGHAERGAALLLLPLRGLHPSPTAIRPILPCRQHRLPRGCQPVRFHGRPSDRWRQSSGGHRNTIAAGPVAAREAKTLVRERPLGIDTAHIAAARRTGVEGQAGLGVAWRWATTRRRPCA